MSALIILDGAPEPLGPRPTTLEDAELPALAALARAGTVRALATTPPGLDPGSETGIPTLLRAPPRVQVGRGLVEAVAAGVRVPPGQSAWRVDLHRSDGTRASAAEASEVLPAARRALPEHSVIHVRGHRLIAIGEEPPALAHVAGLCVRVWGGGATLPRRLDARTVVVSGPGAAAGCARMLGARSIVPAGTTGDVDTDLGAKARAAVGARGDAELVVVHVGAPDEASHRRDRGAKRAALEAIDRTVVAPLAEHFDRLTVTADHGTCPETGEHDPAPVPAVTAGRGVAAAGPDAFCERAVRELRA